MSMIHIRVGLLNEGFFYLNAGLILGCLLNLETYVVTLVTFV